MRTSGIEQSENARYKNLTLLSNSGFPANPEGGELAWRSDTTPKKLWIYDSNQSSWVEAQLGTGETGWTVISDIAEFEAAISLNRKNIFMKNGTYSLTGAFTPYDGLRIVGENTPSDLTNSHLDGVLIDGNVFTWNGSKTTHAGLTITDPARGDFQIDVVAGFPGTTTIEAGSLISVDNLVYFVKDDATDNGAGGIVVSLRDPIARNAAGLTAIAVFSPSQVLKNLELANLQFDFPASNFMLAGAINPKFDNVIFTGDGVESFVFVDHFVNGRFNNVVIGGDDSVDITFANFNVASITKSPGIKVNNSANFDVSNARGQGGGEYEYCVNFTVDNLHTYTPIYVAFCSHFAVQNSSTKDDTTGFEILESSSFTISGCYASNAAVPISILASSNYRQIANEWQTMNGWNIPITKDLIYTALPWDVILCDTTIRAFDITLPAAPPIGTRVMVIDSMSNFSVFHLTVIVPPGEYIRGVINDEVIFDINDYIGEFIYVGGTFGWTYRADV